MSEQFRSAGRVAFSDKANLTRRVLEGRVTAFIRIKKKNYPSFVNGKKYAIMQPYKDLPDEVIKQVTNIKYGLNNKYAVKQRLLPHHINVIARKSVRLHEITQEDMFKLGVERKGENYINGIPGKIYKSPREAFIALVGKIGGRFMWRLNPFIWFYEFELFN